MPLLTYQLLPFLCNIIFPHTNAHDDTNDILLLFGRDPTVGAPPCRAIFFYLFLNFLFFVWDVPLRIYV